MANKKQILDDFIAAFKDKDEIKKRTLESIKAEIMVAEKAKGGGEVDDDKLNTILQSMAKKHRESIEAYDNGGRKELAQKEREELSIIESYLPAQLSEELIRKIAQDIIATNGFTSSNFGQAMGAVMAQLKGQADGAVVSKILQEILSAEK